MKPSKYRKTTITPLKINNFEHLKRQSNHTKCAVLLVIQSLRNVDFQGSYGRLYEIYQAACLNYNGKIGILNIQEYSNKYFKNIQNVSLNLRQQRDTPINRQTVWVFCVCVQLAANHIHLVVITCACIPTYSLY